MTPEGAVKGAMRSALRRIKAWFFMPVPTGRGVGGVPDFIACVPVVITEEMIGQRVGLFVGIETKAPGKEHTVTPLQHRQMDAIRGAGGQVYVISTVDAARNWTLAEE